MYKWQSTTTIVTVQNKVKKNKIYKIIKDIYKHKITILRIKNTISYTKTTEKIHNNRKTWVLHHKCKKNNAKTGVQKMQCLKRQYCCCRVCQISQQRQQKNNSGNWEVISAERCEWIWREITSGNFISQTKSYQLILLLHQSGSFSNSSQHNRYIKWWVHVGNDKVTSVVTFQCMSLKTPNNAAMPQSPIILIVLVIWLSVYMTF